MIKLVGPGFRCPPTPSRKTAFIFILSQVILMFQLALHEVCSWCIKQINYRTASGGQVLRLTRQNVDKEKERDFF